MCIYMYIYLYINIHYTHRTLLTSGTNRLNLPLPVWEAEERSDSIKQRLATTISAALAIASKTT
jgi:hypothetical protein